MAMSSVLGAAWAYGTTAYSYNMGRFQFDAGQRQATEHQMQNMRMSLWNLFREDIRDLFGITTSNMSTYMVIGTLFLGFIISMLWNMLSNYPEDPPWLVLFFHNCVFSAIAFGVLSVWLAMHGTIAAHAASVKVLTQAVRPPIPSSADVASVGSRLTAYEASRPGALLRLPNLLNWQEAVGSEEAASPRRRAAEGRAGAPAAGAPAAGGEPEMEAEAQPLPSGDCCPGPSALLGTHVELFRDLQRTYLSFEAYSRASLTVAAHELLVSCAYFLVANLFALRSERTGLPRHPELVAWTSVGFLTFTSVLLIKLDLFVERMRMRWLKFGVFAGPLLATLAVSLWSSHSLQAHAAAGTPLSAQLAAFLGGVLHLGWTLMIVSEARPDGHARLPMSFRSVQYTDLFGWWYKNRCGPQQPAADPARGSGDEPDSCGPGPEAAGQSGSAQAAGLLRRLTRRMGRFSEERMASVLSAEELQALQDLRGKLEESMDSMQDGARSRAGSSNSLDTGQTFDSGSTGLTRAGGRPTWLRCSHTADTGQPLHYYVNSSTSEVQWDAPPVGQVIDLQSAAALVEEMSQRMAAAAEEPDDARRVHFEASAEEVEMQSVGLDVSDAPSSSLPSFAPMRRRPNSRHESNSMAWKYFAQVGGAVTVLWVVTLAWVAAYGRWAPSPVPGMGGAAASGRECRLGGGEGAPPRPPAGAAEAGLPGSTGEQRALLTRRLDVEWPYPHFEASALACAGSTVVLADRFFVHAAPSIRAPFAPALLSSDLPSRWQALGTVAGGERLLLVESGGGAVLERDLKTNGTEPHPSRRWALGPSADFSLTAVAGLEAAAACAALPAGRPAPAPGWALLGAASTGEVLLLCPLADTLRLQPARVLAKPAGELLGIAAGAAGELWLLSRSRAGAALLRISSNGSAEGAWQLPPGRRWASGLCLLSDGEGLLAAASNVSAKGTVPELWHLQIGSASVGSTLRQVQMV